MHGVAYVIFSGSDAMSGGRQWILRSRLSSRDGPAEVLLDSEHAKLTLLSAPQLCRCDANVTSATFTAAARSGGAASWLLFLANAGDTSRLGVWSLPLDGEMPAHAGAASGRGAAATPIQLVSAATSVPGALPPQQFATFGAPVALSGSEPLAVFVAHGSRGSEGIYAVGVHGGGRVRRLVDTQSRPTRAGGAAGALPFFSSFPHAPSAASGLVIFYATLASSHGQSGMYALRLRGSSEDPGTPYAVATLESANLTYIFARYNGFDESRCLAFYGTTAGSDGVYTIHVE